MYAIARTEKKICISTKDISEWQHTMVSEEIAATQHGTSKHNRIC
jgi:hypothetical protein